MIRCTASLASATGAPLPDADPSDGKSLMPILSGTGTRQKEHIYICYREKVLVRNKQFSLVANRDGSNARFTRYKAAYDGKKLADVNLSEPERAIKANFETILATMEKSRRSALPADSVMTDKDKTKK